MKTHPPSPQLARVRRFEAAGFRAWPASSVSYDGAWLIRLTESYPAKRLNSINPLDPGDIGRFPERIATAARRFEEQGRPPTFRLSPLAGRAITDFLDREGWSVFSESLVMRMDLGAAIIDTAIRQIPLRDIRRFVEAISRMQTSEAAPPQGLATLIAAIQPEVGLFVIEQDGKPLASAICVHDNDLAGIFEVATDPVERGKGYGRRTVLSALQWARSRGAKEAWLQVEADNETALSLYRSIGFSEIYRYHYRRPRSA